MGNSFLNAFTDKFVRELVGVNPLHVGELISTKRQEEEKAAQAARVSIPFTSGNSFLHWDKLVERFKNHCVNPLHVGELISTRRRAPVPEGWPAAVSIPFTSGNSFLLDDVLRFQKAGLRLCQSPSRRGTHFY